MNAELVTFLKLQRQLQAIDPEFPLQYGICLVEIALNEGLSLTGLAQKTGLALSTVSRIVGALSCYRQKGRPYDMVRIQISVNERRRKELYLTSRGRLVVQSLIDAQKNPVSL